MDFTTFDHANITPDTTNTAAFNSPEVFTHEVGNTVSTVSNEESVNTEFFTPDLEAPSPFEVRGWSTEQLVSFGNYLLSDERKQYLFESADPTVVYDSDLENWKLRNAQQ